MKSSSLFSIFIGLFSATSMLVNGASTFVGCDKNQEKQGLQATMRAKLYAGEAVGYLQLDPSTSTQVTQKWFGPFDETRMKTVTDRFNQISSFFGENDDATNTSSITYDCHACSQDRLDEYAYVDLVKEPNVIHLCAKFWTTRETWHHSQGGILIAMASQFPENGAAKNTVHGHGETQQLARENPMLAIQNAENYEYFAENVLSLI